MHDVWEPELTRKIMTFLTRKSEEHPDLKLLAKWDDYEYMPRKRFSARRKFTRFSLKENLQAIWN